MTDPKQWKIVPVEATEEMADAAVNLAISIRLGRKYGWRNYMRDLHKVNLTNAPVSPFVMVSREDLKEVIETTAWRRSDPLLLRLKQALEQEIGE